MNTIAIHGILGVRTRNWEGIGGHESQRHTVCEKDKDSSVHLHVATDRFDMQRAYGSGQCQKLKPRGNWLVTLDVPEYMTPALRSALTNELTCITSGLCRVRFAGDDDAIQPFENSLYVTFTGSGLWTPYLGTYDDTWEFEFSDCGTPVEGFVDVWTLDRSEIRVRGECANEGIGYGIVGRKALTTRRVQKGVEAISQGIAESYGTVVQRQNRPCANEG